MSRSVLRKVKSSAHHFHRHFPATRKGDPRKKVIRKSDDSLVIDDGGRPSLLMRVLSRGEGCSSRPSLFESLRSKSQLSHPRLPEAFLDNPKAAARARASYTAEGLSAHRSPALATQRFDCASASGRIA